MTSLLDRLKRAFGGCEHLRVRESMACDAHCRDCGENLGFIGKWRERTKDNPDATEISNDPSDPQSWRK